MSRQGSVYSYSRALTGFSTDSSAHFTIDKEFPRGTRKHRSKCSITCRGERYAHAHTHVPSPPHPLLAPLHRGLFEASLSSFRLAVSRLLFSLYSCIQWCREIMTDPLGRQKTCEKGGSEASKSLWLCVADKNMKTLAGSDA